MLYTNAAIALSLVAPAMALVGNSTSSVSETANETAVSTQSQITSWTTEIDIVTALTTYCPEPTNIVTNNKTYTVTGATTLTITDCPCTITTTKPCPTTTEGTTTIKSKTTSHSESPKSTHSVQDNSNGANARVPTVAGAIFAGLMLL